jgi:hypothetical protein
MPRDSNGTMTAPAGQPVVGGTPALASVFNLLVADLVAELTDSLSRSGKGGMLAPFEFSDGTVGDPSATFTNNPTCGLYRAGAGDIRLSHLGVDMAVLTTALLKLIGHCVDGASAVGITLDTVNELTTTGAKLLSVLNHAVEKFYVDKDGAVSAGSTVSAGNGLFAALTAVGATLLGNVADGASAVGVILDCVNALSTSGAKALSIRNSGVEKAYIDKDGEVRGLGGVYGVGKTDGIGVSGIGDGSGGGVYGEGGVTDGDGVVGQGTGGGDGVFGTGGTTNGRGVRGVGNGAAAGVSGVGGDSSGPGVGGQGGSPNGNGISAGGTGTGAGIQAYGGTTGPGGILGAGGGGSPARGAVNVVPQAAPSAPSNGDMWVEAGTNTLKVRINGATKTVTLT